MNFFSVLFNFRNLEFVNTLQRSEEGFSLLPQEDKKVSYMESALNSMRNLNDRIQQGCNHTRGYMTSIIDGVVKTNTLNESIRKEHLDFWESRKLEMCVFTALGGPLVVVIPAIIKDEKILSVANTIVGLSMMIFGCYRFYQCEKQAAYWRFDLPTTIANQRKDAFKKGIIFLMEQDLLKNEIQPSYASVLSRNELRGLYFQYLYNKKKEFESFIDIKQHLSNLIKIKSPLSLDVIQYAQLRSDDIGKLKFYIDRYEKLIHEFVSVQKETAELKESVENSSDRRMIKKSKDLLLINFNYNQDRKRLEEEEYRVLLASKSIEERAQVRQKFSERLSKLRDQFNDLKLIEKNRVNSIDIKKDGILYEIDQYRNIKFLSLYNEMKLLYTNAYLVLNGRFS